MAEEQSAVTRIAAGTGVSLVVGGVVGAAHAAWQDTPMLKTRIASHLAHTYAGF